MQYIPVLILILCCWLASSSWAAPPKYLAPKVVQAQLETYVLNQLQPHRPGRLVVDVKALQSRIRLKHCEQDLNFDAPEEAMLSRRFNVAVSCEQPCWQVYLPVVIKEYRQVVVSTRDLNRGETINAADLALREHNIATLTSGYHEAKTAVLDHVANQPIRAGQVILPRQLRKLNLVKQGQVVRILGLGQGIRIEAAGTAMQSGALGDLIRIKNKISSRVVEAEIIGPGQAKVPL